MIAMEGILYFLWSFSLSVAGLMYFSGGYSSCYLFYLNISGVLRYEHKIEDTKLYNNREVIGFGNFHFLFFFLLFFS